MKKILYIPMAVLLFMANSLLAQVSTIFNNEQIISSKGQFEKNYTSTIDFVIPLKNIDSLLVKERQDSGESIEVKPFRLATPITVNLDIAKYIKWNYDNEFAFGKFTIKLSGALSSSINFDNFYLPENTELYIYNEGGNMVTGPVTEKENNINKIWGSWVYQGEFITLEIKTPIATLNDLVLHSNNLAYGYKEIYKSIKVGGFGTSGACNINVICPLGNGWEAERNSVSTILSATGVEFCSGSLIMNTCGTNTPYYLTANHCFNGNTNTAGWRFAFQAWSTTCPNPGINTNGVMYNGSTLRARNAATDFCLVELNTTPPANSGLQYAGWSRSTIPATNGMGIHHPRGDLMKISSYIVPLIRADNPNLCGIVPISGLSWVVNWNNGVTEPGSSGSPLFDQNHRIVGQLGGGPSSCTAAANCRSDGYGRFDNSWTGGGTNATRLSNWLDPTGTGAVTTNTSNISNLPPPVNSGLYSISGSRTICNSATYSITPALPPNTSVLWSVNNSSFVVAQNTPVANQATVTAVGNATSATLTATITGCGNTATAVLPINQPYPYSTCSGGSGIVRTAAYPTLVPSNCTISVSLNLPPGASVVYTSLGTGPQHVPPTSWGYSTSTGMLSFQIPFGVNGVTVSFTISNNNCSNGMISFYAFSSGGRFSFTAAPNPVQQSLIINANELPITENSKTSAITTSEKAALQFTINVYDVNINRLLLTQRSSKGSMQQQLNVSKLKPGYYVVEITQGNNKQSIKFLKE